MYVLQDLEMKNIDMKKTKFIDYLYDTVMNSSRNHPQSPLRVLTRFIVDNPNKKKI